MTQKTYLNSQAFVVWCAALGMSQNKFGPTPSDSYITMMSNQIPGSSWSSHKYFDTDKANAFMGRSAGNGAYGIMRCEDRSAIIHYTSQMLEGHFCTIYALLSKPEGDEEYVEIYDMQTVFKEGATRKELWSQK